MHTLTDFIRHRSFTQDYICFLNSHSYFIQAVKFLMNFVPQICKKDKNEKIVYDRGWGGAG